MTEQECIERLKCMRLFMQINDDNNDSKFLEDDYIANDMAIKALEEIQQYRALGTVEEFKALKEKNTPMELDEHNFQDEPHHYLCPSCRCIISYTQNYCEWCGQALEG